MKGLFYLLAIVGFFSACQQEDLKPQAYIAKAPVLPAESYNYVDIELPHNWDESILLGNTWGVDNTTTNKGATLGRVLFYDKQLSLNNTISCGSCHLQELGFADREALSVGIEGHKTDRNSMSICNAGASNQYFWDLRASGLENQVIMPIQNHIEMGFERIDNLVTKLDRIDYYKPLFADAFGSEEITEERIAFAMSQFLRSIVSFNSKFDEGVASNFSNFSPLEEEGRILFMETLHCGTCHDGHDLGGWGSANIGLNMTYKDKGVGALNNDLDIENGFGPNGDVINDQFVVPGEDPDPNGLGNIPFDGGNVGDFFPDDFFPFSWNQDGEFKIPGLRNIELTGPYMHDGRFKTLREVIDHYSDHVVNHPNLSWRIKREPTEQEIFEGKFEQGETVTRLNLTESEKAALEAFLLTLTDYEMTSDIKFSNPFH